MCGIAGKIYYNSDKRVDPSMIKAMMDVQVHRGPNAEGLYDGGRVVLGHRRLSIIDVVSGNQPMSNDDGSIWLAYNGEIYNFQEIKKELQDKGYTFKTKSDTEVLIRLYEDKGIDCLKRLRGMFAFAIWDVRNEKLFVARDRLGQKPLLYSEVPGGVVFASEFRAILKDPGISKEMDYDALNDYLTYGYVPSPNSIYSGVKKLEPAHYMVIEKGKIRIERYWDLDFSNKLKLSEDEYEKLILDNLRESTRLRMISDVPLGAFLSGGVDSSAVVAMMSEVSPDRVKTFSIGFKNKAYNELEYARKVADRLGTDHNEIIIGSEGLDIISRLVDHYGEPYADSSAVPTYYVSKATREYVTVALSGDAGDESFAGYDRYKAGLLATYLYRMPKRVLEFICRALEGEGIYARDMKDPRVRMVRFLQGCLSSSNPGRRHAMWLSYFTNDQKKSILPDHFKKNLRNADSYTYMGAVFDCAKAEDIVEKLMYTDIKTTLPEDYLVKTDIASMANSLEIRSPFLDHKFMETVAGVPVKYKLKGLTSKYLLKKLCSKKIPPEVLYRKKCGFAAPLNSWFGDKFSGYLRDTLLSSTSACRKFFNISFVEQMLAEHQSNRINHTYRLWMLLMFELWYQRFMK